MTGKKHYSVGALIKNDKDEFLMIDRAKPPLGFAGVAGHIDPGETPEEALVREVKEESGLDVVSYNLIREKNIDWNWCRKGIKGHYWYLFDVKVKGEINRSLTETKDISWISNIGDKTLETVWKHWFTDLGYIDNLIEKNDCIE
ncbi:NUDIX hydrolase, partial [Nanoarchaeota archaeon]